MTARVCAILLGILIMSPVVRLHAQTWTLDAYGGRANYQSVPPEASSSAAVAIRYREDKREFQGGLGLPLTRNDITWGAVGAGDRFAFRRGGLTAGADAFGLAHIQRDPVVDMTGTGLLVEGLPTVAYTFGSNLVEGRSGPRWYRGSIGDASWTRTLWTTEFRAATVPDDRFLFEGGFRHDRNRQGEAYTRVGFRGFTSLKRFDLEGSLGHWVDGVVQAKTEWDLSVAVPITERLSVFTSAQYENFNPQFLGPPRTSWAAGITLKLWRQDSSSLGEGIQVLPDNRVMIRIPVNESPSAAYIAGDFNGWTPASMRRQGDEWILPLQLSPGVYKFAFRTGEGEWFVPKSIQSRTGDGMGGWVATLVVP